MISLNIPITQCFGSGCRLRSGAAVFVAAFFFLAGEALSQEPSATPASSPSAETQPVFPVRVLTTRIVEMESLLRIGVYGDLANEVTQKLKNNPETATKDLQLYLNGIAMPGIVPTILRVDSELPAGFPKPVYELQYCLTRDSDNEANRKGWEDFLTSLRFGQQKVQVGVGYVGQIPYLSPRDDLSFQVRSPLLITLVIVLGLIVLVGLFAWFRFTPLLREAGPATVFSRGKSRMAFWGTVVALSFLGVCIISHRLERIPSQTLVLLGISGATGLSSVLISQSKRAAAAEEKEKLEEKAKQVALTASNAQKAEATKKINAQEQNANPPKGKDKWLVDILSDANGLSFYRFQVFIWTITLGGFFIWHVANKLSMPEFDTTL